MTKIAYEPHPVSKERKAELRAQGYTIIDARFKPAEPIAEQVQTVEEIKAEPKPKPKRTSTRKTKESAE